MNVYKLSYSIYRLAGPAEQARKYEQDGREGQASSGLYYSPVMDYDLAYWPERGWDQIEILETDLTLGQVYSYINGSWTGGSLEQKSEKIAGNNIEIKKKVEKVNELAVDQVKVVLELLGQRRLTIAELASLYQRQAKYQQDLGGSKRRTLDRVRVTAGQEERQQREEEREESWGDSRKFVEGLQRLYLEGQISIKPSIYEGQAGKMVCGRCLTSEGITGHHCAACRSDCYYCGSCARYGETRTCLPLLEVISDRNQDKRGKINQRENIVDNKVDNKVENKEDSKEEKLITGDLEINGRNGNSVNKGTSPIYPHPLTPDQAAASQRILELVQAGENGLVWAVTGAGKTEMVFAAIAWVLSREQNSKELDSDSTFISDFGSDLTYACKARVLVATPRKDVVMELLPRFRAAFPGIAINAVYGGSEAKHLDSQLILASTHQLIRYRDQTFDLVIIDETDAFPYAGDELLYNHAHRVGRGQHIYMTATPDQKLMNSVPANNVVSLFGRHHGRPLPEPVWMQLPKLTVKPGLLAKLKKGREFLHPAFLTALNQIPESSLGMIFVPSINRGHYLRKLLTDYYGESRRIAFVYAADPERMAKIQALRERAYDLVITTTILERGVTIPDSHVIVIDAENPVFTKSTLIQIAGRVGRTVDYPSGVVLFLGKYLTKETKAAIQEIKAINKMEKRRQEKIKTSKKI